MTPTPVSVRPLPAVPLVALGQVGFGGWLAEYAKSRGMAESHSAYLGSAFWAGLTTGMLGSIFVATRVSCRTLLFTCSVAAVLPVLAITLVPGSRPLLWLACCVLGVSMGPIYPSVMSFFTNEVRPMW